MPSDANPGHGYMKLMQQFLDLARTKSQVAGALAVLYDKNHMELVNGITISPKRGFCIVKIWLKNCTLQDPNIIVDVENLVKVGCLFKTHKAEF